MSLLVGEARSKTPCPEGSINPKERTESDDREVAPDPIVQSLLPLFIDTVRWRLGLLEAALLRNDLATAEVHALTIKGSAGSYGFPEISSAVQRICDVLKGKLDSTNPFDDLMRCRLRLEEIAAKLDA